LIVGAITQVTKDLRYSFWFLLILYLIPCVVLFTIDVEKSKQEAEEFLKKSYSSKQKGLIKNFS